MKILIGFILGLTTTAIAKDASIDIMTDVRGYFMAGVNPDNLAAAIKVDKDGYVICSDKSK